LQWQGSTCVGVDPMINEKKRQIISYYERCLRNYKKWWHLDSSRAIHAGYWDETTMTLQQALERENQILAQKARVQPEDDVLDIGCGVGGSAIFLASRIGCKVIGIDLGEELIHQAKQYAQEVDVEVEFMVMDYEDMSLTSESFDVLWILESFCHARDKARFMGEAFRLLRKGGRIVLADGFIMSPGDGVEGKRQLKKMEEGLGDSEYIAVDELMRMMEKVGFRRLEYEDITEHVKPSARRLYYYAIPLILWSKLGEYFGFSTLENTKDYKGYYDQYVPLKRGLVGYGIAYGEK
jgi:tocopherol O-methyltransferase